MELTHIAYLFAAGVVAPPDSGYQQRRTPA